MRRFTKSALAGALGAAALTVVVASPANAATATLTFDDGVLYSGCFDVPYSFTLDLPSGTTNWSLEVSISKPDGTEIGSDYTSGTGRIGTLSSEVFLCGSDDAGQLTATGVVEGRGSSIAPYELDVTPTTFTMRRPYSQTTAKLVGKPRCGKTVKINVSSLDERPNGFFPAEYGDVALQQQVKGKWRLMRYSDEYIEDGAAQVEFTWTKQKKTCQAVTVRAVTLYDSDLHEQSYSSAITIR